mgnify:CR=1 FL=1
MTSESITETNSDDRSRWLALYVLCAGVLMIVLDATVVNVALPTIQDDLDFTNANLAWVVNAYLIAFGGSLLLAGRLGDLIGKRAIFLSGMAIFTGLSLICGLAPTQEVLIGARFFQGVGGAMTAAVALGMIVTMFPEPREQAKAIGVYAFVASAGGSVGLLAGGVLLLAGCAKDAPQDTWQPAGPNARSIDNLQRPIFYIAGVIGVLVFATIGYAIWKFKDRGQEIPEQGHGKAILEIGPIVLSVLAGVTVNFQVGLRSGLTLRWLAQVWELYSGTITLSLLIAFACLVVTTLIGVPTAYVLARSQGAFARLVEEFLVLPIAIPGIAIALGLNVIVELVPPP